MQPASCAAGKRTTEKAHSYRIIDLCSGFGGGTAAFQDAGMPVLTIDINAEVRPIVQADVRNLPIRLDTAPLLVWASPPCTEYSRWDQRASLFPKQGPPDLSLWLACEKAIVGLNPDWWVIENVRGAQDWHGKANYHFGPYYLWTNIWLLPSLGHQWPSKGLICGGNAKNSSSKRGRLPYGISWAIASFVAAHEQLMNERGP